MRYTRKELVKKCRNVSVFFNAIFLLVICMSGYKIIKADGDFWPEFYETLFVHPGLAIPFVVTTILSVFLIWRYRKY
jgi:hypothetical protein